MARNYSLYLKHLYKLEKVKRKLMNFVITYREEAKTASEAAGPP